MRELPVRRRPGPLLFLPFPLQRPAVVKWLKRVHAWTGLWGALLFSCLGTSGFLLNHRSTLKIDTGAPREVSALDVAVRPGLIRNEQGLDAWTKATLGVRSEGRSPPPEPAGPKSLLGRPLPQAERWTRVFALPDGKLTVSTTPGSPAVSVRREAVGALGLLKNLHKGTGLGVAWVLLLDTMAGALVAMSVTGVLLWSRLHGSRLLAAALAGGSLLWALTAVMPNL